MDFFYDKILPTDIRVASGLHRTRNEITSQLDSGTLPAIFTAVFYRFTSAATPVINVSCSKASDIPFERLNEKLYLRFLSGMVSI